MALPFAVGLLEEPISQSAGVKSMIPGKAHSHWHSHEQAGSWMNARSESKAYGLDARVLRLRMAGPKQFWITALLWILGGWAGLHRYAGGHCCYVFLPSLLALVACKSCSSSDHDVAVVLT